MKKQKSRPGWPIFAFLVIALIIGGWWFIHRGSGEEFDLPALGPSGSEQYSTGDDSSAPAICDDSKIGVSVPASFTVHGGKTQIAIKNTGEVGFVPSALIEGKEVFRASRVLEPGQRVQASIPVQEGAQKCVILVESVKGGKFTVTSTLEERSF